MMKLTFGLLVAMTGVAGGTAAELQISAFNRQGTLVVTNCFANGVVTFERATTPDGGWVPEKSTFSSTTTAQAKLDLTGSTGIFRARALDLSGGTGAWTFVDGDILDLTALVFRLTTSAADDLVTQYVADRLTLETQDALFLYGGGPDPVLEQTLITEFSGMLRDESFYDAQRYSNVPLSISTRALLEQPAQGEALAHRNRLLFEDAYPRELRQKRAAGFTNLVQSFGTLTTVAGSGNILCSACNSWQSSYEGGAATDAALSSPHIAMADRAGNVYIADKRAHAIRKVIADGTISTVAGTGNLGRGTTDPAPATSVDLNNPNGLWVLDDGTLYILDRDNGLIRKVDPAGVMTTVTDNGTPIPGGRGLWVSPDESVLYFAAATQIKVWDVTNGLAVFASGFAQAGNLAVDPQGHLVVTDSDLSQVIRIESDGSQTVIAGNGTATGGGDGQLATETGLYQVRAIWFLSTGAYFLGTDAGSQVWYVDPDGHVHLFLDGNTAGSHSGDGSWFYANSDVPKTSFVKQITMDGDGNLLITESTAGYVRKIRFLPPTP